MFIFNVIYLLICYKFGLQSLQILTFIVTNLDSIVTNLDS